MILSHWVPDEVWETCVSVKEVVMARVFSRRKVREVVEETGMSVADVLYVLKERREDLKAVKAWVEQNEGATELEVLEGVFGQDGQVERQVLWVAEALDLVVRIEGGDDE